MNEWCRLEADNVTKRLNSLYNLGVFSSADFSLHSLTDEEWYTRFPQAGGNCGGCMGMNNVPGPIESAFMTALDEGNVPINGGTVGNAWQREKKNNPELKAAYAKLSQAPSNKGRIPEVQRAFRLEWAKKKYEQAKTQRTRTFTQKESTITRGMYMNPANIWKKEGEGRTGLSAMKNYVFMALAVGGRFVSWNPGAKMLEIMYLEKSFQQELTMQFEVKTTQQAEPSSSGSSTAPNAAAAATGTAVPARSSTALSAECPLEATGAKPPADAAPPAQATAAAVPAAATTRTEAASPRMTSARILKRRGSGEASHAKSPAARIITKTKTKAAVPEEGTPEFEAMMKKRKETKEMQVWWKQTCTLHAKLKTAQSEHEHLSEMINTSEAWKWARESEPYKWVTEAHKEYLNARKLNQFYNEFL